MTAPLMELTSPCPATAVLFPVNSRPVYIAMQVFCLMVACAVVAASFAFGAYSLGIFSCFTALVYIPVVLFRLVRHMELDLARGSLNIFTYSFYTWRIPLSSIKEVRFSDFTDRFWSWKLSSPYVQRVTIVRHFGRNILVSPEDPILFITTIRQTLSPDFV
jgi:hypothetical protein